MIKYSQTLTQQLNRDIKEYYPHIFPVTDSMHMSFDGVSRLVMLDRYTQKDMTLKSLKVGDLVVTVIKHDPKFPARGIGYVQEILEDDTLMVQIEDEFIGQIGDEHQNGLIKRQYRDIEKPLEIYYEQIARRVGHHLGEDESDETIQAFVHELEHLNLVPADRKSVV